MILDDLKNHIEVTGIASGKDLAKQFYLTEDGVDAMLNVFIKKGQISRLVDTNKHSQVTRVRYRSVEANALSLTVTMQLFIKVAKLDK